MSLKVILLDTFTIKDRDTFSYLNHLQITSIPAFLKTSFLPVYFIDRTIKH